MYHLSVGHGMYSPMLSLMPFCVLNKHRANHMVPSFTLNVRLLFELRGMLIARTANTTLPTLLSIGGRLQQHVDWTLDKRHVVLKLPGQLANITDVMLCVSNLCDTKYTYKWNETNNETNISHIADEKRKSQLYWVEEHV